MRSLFISFPDETDFKRHQQQSLEQKNEQPQKQFLKSVTSLVGQDSYIRFIITRIIIITVRVVTIKSNSKHSLQW